MCESGANSPPRGPALCDLWPKPTLPGCSPASPSPLTLCSQESSVPILHLGFPAHSCVGNRPPTHTRSTCLVSLRSPGKNRHLVPSSPGACAMICQSGWAHPRRSLNSRRESWLRAWWSDTLFTQSRAGRVSVAGTQVTLFLFTQDRARHPVCVGNCREGTTWVLP